MEKNASTEIALKQYAGLIEFELRQLYVETGVAETSCVRVQHSSLVYSYDTRLPHRVVVAYPACLLRYSTHCSTLKPYSHLRENSGCVTSSQNAV